MIKIFEYKKDFDKVKRFIEYNNVFMSNIENTVKNIVEDVRGKGDNALLGYIKKFDNAVLNKNELSVSEEEINNSVKEVDKEFLKILREARRNITNYHKRGVAKGFIYEDGDGVKLGKIVRPIGSLGIYIPGGKAVYPSSVLMNVCLLYTSPSPRD